MEATRDGQQAKHHQEDTNHRLQERGNQQYQYAEHEQYDAKKCALVHASPPLRTQARQLSCSTGSAQRTGVTPRTL